MNIESGKADEATIPMNAANLHGSFFAVALYDVCDEINLEELRPLIGGSLLAPTFKHSTPGYVRFEHAPVIESLEAVSLKSGEQFTGTVQYYDYGVIGVLLRFSFSGTWADLKQLASRWVSNPLFDELTNQLVQERVEKVRPALYKSYKQWLDEDYYIFHITTSQWNAQDLMREHGQDISEILHGETAKLSMQETDEVLQGGSISYYANDWTVIVWNSAFVYDTEAGAETTIRILEYANSQLLQFRHYDELLSRELRQAYRFLESRRGLLSGWRVRPVATRLRTILLEINDLTERTNNALKFVGDMFSARLYKLSATKIGVTGYQKLVEDKLQTADELYDFMIEQFHQARGFFLELIVVIILIIELFFLFRGK